MVTASPLEQKADETATPVATLTGDDLVHRRQATLGDTLAGQPGINFDNFGGGASRPVIRGQTAPRVQSLSDGANIQDASAISPDHAITTEPLLLRGIEVLRGPATLLYGGSAIGGAINLLDDKVPTAIPEGGISGMAEGRLGTANPERSLVGGMSTAPTTIRPRSASAVPGSARTAISASPIRANAANMDYRATATNMNPAILTAAACIAVATITAKTITITITITIMTMITTITMTKCPS
ncbi:TonB-dependent receptor plug domain-containing protein [Sphingobium cloacae]